MKIEKEESQAEAEAFQKNDGRKPTAGELEEFGIGSRLSIEQLKIAGCMINYPSD